MGGGKSEFTVSWYWDWKGRSQGLTEGLTNSILTILQSKGTLTEKMISKVKKEEDQTVLNSWLLKASQAPDPETFWKEIE